MQQGNRLQLPSLFLIQNFLKETLFNMLMKIRHFKNVYFSCFQNHYLGMIKNIIIGNLQVFLSNSRMEITLKLIKRLR
jgi:hypothetical protein